MSTVRANLDPTQYVKVSDGNGSLVLQSHRDTVRVAFGHIKPSISNQIFHELSGAHDPLPVPYTDEPVWALAMTDRSALTLTKFPHPQRALADASDRLAVVSMAGELITGTRVDAVSVNFQYGISSFDVDNINDVTGTGVVGTSGSMATLSTGTGVGSATLQSLDTVRYRSGHEIYCAPSIVFAVPEVNVNQYAGLLDPVDGWALGYQGLAPGLWFIEGGNVNFIPQTDWNIDKLDGAGESGYTIDMQKGQVPDLKYVWHGLKNMVLEMTADDGRSLPCHRLNFINSATTAHLKNPSLPVTLKIERTSGTGANLTLKTGSWRAGSVVGRKDDNAADRWFSVVSLEFPLLSSVRNNIFTVRNKATFNGKINHTVVELAVTDFINDANKTLTIYGIEGATLDGAGAYADVDTANSVLEVSRGGTLVLGSGRVGGPAAPVQKTQHRTREVLGSGIKIYPGKTLSFSVPTVTNSTGTFTVVARFVEYH